MRHTEPSARQCAWGNIGEKPGTVTLRPKREPIPPGLEVAKSQASDSGGNC